MREIVMSKVFIPGNTLYWDKGVAVGLKFQGSSRSCLGASLSVKDVHDDTLDFNFFSFPSRTRMSTGNEAMRHRGYAAGVEPQEIIHRRV
jgi:hypothetical protein